MKDIASAIGGMQRGVQNFQAEMRTKGIHVGMKDRGVVRCVTCGEDWPCTGSKPPADEGRA